MRKKSPGRKKMQILREGISARILLPVFQELKWAEQQFPYLTRSELIQAAIAFYVRELRKRGMETGSWFPQGLREHLMDTSNGSGVRAQEIRDLWQVHEGAEDRRDIPGILNTLVPDCVYEVPQWGIQWVGHQGAAQFYTEFFQTFPDLHLRHERMVVGPQGLAKVAKARGTPAQPWLQFKPSKSPVTFSAAVFLSWDGTRDRFKGECLYFEGPRAGPGKRKDN